MQDIAHAVHGFENSLGIFERTNDFLTHGSRRPQIEAANDAAP